MSKNSLPQPHAAWSVAPQRGSVSRETINACSVSLGAYADYVISSPDESYIAPFLGLHASMKDECLASLTRTLIDCVRRASDVSCNNVESIKQLIDDIDSVIEKKYSLCKSKDMHNVFNESSHIADVSTGRMGDKHSCLRSVSDLDQRLFKTRKDLCDFITEVQSACGGNDSTLINKLISNIEIVSGLKQQTVDTLIKIHCKNDAFNIISEIKSMYQPSISKKSHFALHRFKTKLATLGSLPSKAAGNLTLYSRSDSEKADSIVYSKAWGEYKPPVDADVATDDPSSNSVLSPTHDIVLNCDNDVTKSVNALSVSAPVGLQGSVANLSQSSDALVHSQAKSDQCEPVDHVNVCAKSNVK